MFFLRYIFYRLDIAVREGYIEKVMHALNLFLREIVGVGRRRRKLKLARFEDRQLRLLKRFGQNPILMGMTI